MNFRLTALLNEFETYEIKNITIVTYFVVSNIKVKSFYKLLIMTIVVMIIIIIIK